MAKGPRRDHTPVFKLKVALAAFKGDKTVAELTLDYDFFWNVRSPTCHVNDHLSAKITAKAWRKLLYAVKLYQIEKALIRQRSGTARWRSHVFSSSELGIKSLGFLHHSPYAIRDPLF